MLKVPELTMLTLTSGTLTSSGAHGDNFGHLLSQGSAESQTQQNVNEWKTKWEGLPS